MRQFPLLHKATAKTVKYYTSFLLKNSLKYFVLYSDDLKAKVYKLKKGKYDKQGDFTTEKYNFKDVECDASLDFKKVFQKFRK